MNNGVLQVYCNGEMNYSLKGKHAKVCNLGFEVLKVPGHVTA